MAGNLEFIHKETISASTSSVSIDNVFSSNYDVYKITINGVSTAGTIGTFLAIRFIDNAGSVISDLEYDWADLEMRSDTIFSNDNDIGVSFMRMNGVTDQSPESMGANVNIYNPYDSSSYTFINGQSSGITTNLRGGKNIGVHKVAETIRGFAVIETNGSRPFDSGTISVYGLASN